MRLTFALLALLLPAVAHSWEIPKPIYNSVVLLDAPAGRGTGFHVKGDSGTTYILTNKHVCTLGSDSGMVAVMESGAAKLIHIVGISKNFDLCLMDSADGEALPLGDEPAYRQVIRIYGHPLGGPLSFSMGPIESRTDDEFFSEANVLPGNSGSPVLDERGNVVGIVLAYYPDTRHSIFISVDRIREMLSWY